jgi:hypothetical protein
MKHLLRTVTVAIAALYALGAVPPLLAAAVETSAILSMRQDTAFTPASFLVPLAFFALAALLLAAARGLFKEQRWVRWPFLLVALISLLLVLQSVPAAHGLISHFLRPPEGAYKVITAAELSEQLQRFIPMVTLFLVTSAAAVFVFYRTKQQ